MVKHVSEVLEPLFRQHFGYDVKAASDAAAVVPVGESLTVQSMAEDADINVLMRRYGVTGKLPENLRLPEYGDFDHITDFRSALESVEATAAEFMRIPAEIRARFDNDPQKFLEYVADPKNDEQLRKDGLKRPYTKEEAEAKEAAWKASPEYRLEQLERQAQERAASAKTA